MYTFTSLEVVFPIQMSTFGKPLTLKTANFVLKDFGFAQVLKAGSNEEGPGGSAGVVVASAGDVVGVRDVGAGGEEGVSFD